MEMLGVGVTLDWLSSGDEGGASRPVGSDLTFQELLVEKALKLGGIHVQSLIQTREERRNPVSAQELRGTPAFLCRSAQTSKPSVPTQCPSSLS